MPIQSIEYRWKYSKKKKTQSTKSWKERRNVEEEKKIIEEKRKEVEAKKSN